MASPRLRKTMQYGLAALGPISSAGAQFLLSLQLLHALDPASFGAFSFLLVVSQLSFGVSSALLCAPFPVLLSRPHIDTSATIACFQAANLALSALALGVFAGLGLALGLSGAMVPIFAAYAAVMLLRWFGRSFAYARGEQRRSVASDLIYGALLLLAILAMVLTDSVSLLLAYGALLVSAVAALLPLGRNFLGGQFLRFSPKALTDYRAIWHEHSKWSLSGVATTELTANAHAYVVALLIGPSAFAPLAASALLVRPVGLVTNALTDFERPQLARKLAKDGFRATDGSVRMFTVILMSVWLLCAVAAVALVVFAPWLIFPDHYALDILTTGSALWFAVMFIRTLRTPNSVLLQAGGQFRSLAFASYVSCGISVVMVVALAATMGPVWSIAGIAAGEAVFAIQTARQAARWKGGLTMPAAPLNAPGE